MKKKILAGLASGLIMIGTAGMAQALTMSDVGSIDHLLATADLGNSGDATALNWVNNTLDGLGLGDDHEFVFKDEDFGVSYVDWKTITDNAGAFAYELGDAPAYFLIKTGNLRATSNDHFLFANLASIDWAVISLAEIGCLPQDILNIQKVSHISGYDANQPVPEPATMLMFGVGLAGLSGFVRKKYRAA